MYKSGKCITVNVDRDSKDTGSCKKREREREREREGLKIRIWVLDGKLQNWEENEGRGFRVMIKYCTEGGSVDAF